MRIERLFAESHVLLLPHVLVNLTLLFNLPIIVIFGRSAVLFDLHPQDERNKRFDILLDAFEDQYNADMAQCENRMRRQRRLGALLGNSYDNTIVAEHSTWLDEPEEEEEKFQRHLREVKRKAQEFRKFNPWTSDIVRTVYFFGE